MHNMPHITTAEVALVCTAALLLCILPSLIAWGDARRVRRQRRIAANEIQRRSLVEAAMPPVQNMGSAPLSAAEAERAPLPVLEAPIEVAAPAPAEQEPTSSPEPIAAAAPTASLDTEAPVVTEALPLEVPAPPMVEETAICTLRLDELRWVKLPNWPPAALREDPERRRLWEEGQRVAAQPLITTTALPSPRQAESVCLESVESNGSVLHLRFLLFPELWPVGPDQATAVAIFEIDSANGEVRSRIQSR